MSLDHFTDQQMLDELLERRVERELGGENLEYCHDCRHFKPWGRKSEPPDDYNPCQRKHSMRFRMPEEWEDPHADHGYYRRVCSDRAPLPPPRPQPEPDPPPPGPSLPTSSVVPGGKKAKRTPTKKQ